MNKNLIYAIPIGILIIYLAFTLGRKTPLFKFGPSQRLVNTGLEKYALAAAGTDEKFEYLSRSANSSCSVNFKDSISSLSDNTTLKGSCCSPMGNHRYKEQVAGLTKFKDIPEIPPDPYDVNVGLAKKLMVYYDEPLTSKEQKDYDYAMENSDEKGPCCCKCWRWFVYGGLGKYLIKNYGFSGEQVTEVWNLSDGCGGEGDHYHG